VAERPDDRLELLACRREAVLARSAAGVHDALHDPPPFELPEPLDQQAAAHLASSRTVAKYGVPLAWFEWLANASEAQRRDFSIVGGGAGIWWDTLDDGLSVPRLFGLPEDL